MDHGTETVIETCHLTKCYGNKAAVNDLNLSIGAGEIFGLLGPNGAGKTTTTLMLLGLTEPTGGKAVIKGLDCTRNPIDVKRIVGYLPDSVGFYRDMTGRENLRYTGRLNGLPEPVIEERIRLLLDRVKMTYAADKKTGTYSRGMKQRLGIADVLMKDPQIIILDEPTLGIDPEGMRELLLLLRELAEEDGKTLLISSHQLYQIQQICDRVGIFVDGELIACGPIDELGRQIEREGSYTVEVAAYPDNRRLEELLTSLTSVETTEKENDMYIIRSGMDIRRTMGSLLAENGYTILHLRQRGGDLDEIYRRYFEKAGHNHESIVTETKRSKWFIPGFGKRVKS